MGENPYGLNIQGFQSKADLLWVSQGLGETSHVDGQQVEIPVLVV